MSDRVVLDGARGEGGGQILRTGMALCALLGRPLEIANIRAGRRNPGLAAQHLTGVRAVAAVCGGSLQGDSLGSQDIAFTPGPVKGGEYTFDVADVKASAGSVGMLFLALLPVLAFAPQASRVTLKGGTHAKWAPPVHYLRDVLLPVLARAGLTASVDTVTWGWYPQGRGEAVADVRPAGVLNALDLTVRPAIEGVSLLSTVSNLPLSIARRQQDRARKRLGDEGLSVRVETAKAPSPGKGTFVFVLGRYGGVPAGFSALGELGKPAETVADEAVDAFFEHHRTDAPVDPHLADQVLPFLALADGRSTFRTSKVTGHLQTVADVTRQITGSGIRIDGSTGSPGEVTVEGIGFTR